MTSCLEYFLFCLSFGVSPGISCFGTLVLDLSLRIVRLGRCAGDLSVWHSI